MESGNTPIDSTVPVIRQEWLAGIEMTQAQKDQWLAALRSGEYKQAKSELCDIDMESRATLGYCCLGVLGKAAFNLDDQRLNTGNWLDEVDLIGVLGDSDSSEHPGRYNHTKPETWTSIQRVLAGLNDSGWTFAQIADFIEANIPACDAPATLPTLLPGDPGSGCISERVS